ncbi:MAG: LysR family transcriptional regulator [Lachnospiraceae bacterium]
MNDIDWRILAVLYEKKSITKAAEVLFITQSALTKRLRSIENEWNTEIVKRTSKGVVFTDHGKYLVKRARIILDVHAEIKDHFEEQGEVKELIKIGVPNSYARLHFPKLLKEYIGQHDQLYFKTIPNSSDVIVRQVIDETLDIGIVCGDYSFAGENMLLFKEELFVIAPMGTKLDEIEQMPLIESYYNPLVKSIVDQWWKRYFGSMPHGAHKVPYAEIAIEMVENGLGASFLFGNDWHWNAEKVQLIPIYDDTGQPIARNVWMLISNRCFRSQAIADFVTFAENFYQTI